MLIVWETGQRWLIFKLKACWYLDSWPQTCQQILNKSVRLDAKGKNRKRYKGCVLYQTLTPILWDNQNQSPRAKNVVSSEKTAAIFIWIQTFCSLLRNINLSDFSER